MSRLMEWAMNTSPGDTVKRDALDLLRDFLVVMHVYRDRELVEAMERLAVRARRIVEA
jgi:hypothetical protein